MNLWPLDEGTCAFTSRATLDYNCVGFAVGEFRWFDPSGTEGTTWPDDLPRDGSAVTFCKLFERFGFLSCNAPDPEVGFEKIAVFADADGDFTHVARQRLGGQWVSKLGNFEDVEHPLAPMDGSRYGAICSYMRRPAAADVCLSDRYRS